MVIINIDNAKIDTHALLENLPAGVVVHELDTSIIFANKEALKLLRLSWSQAVGKDALDSGWRFLDASGQPLSLQEYPVNQVINGKVISGMIVGILNDEVPEPTWVSVNAYLDDSIQQRPRVIVSFTDITAQYEIPFKEIVDKAKDIVLVTNANVLDKPSGPQIVYVNDAFCQLSGFSKEEVLGKTPRILQGEDTDKASLARIKKRLKNHQSVQETLLNYSKNGTPYWIDISVYPLHMHGGDKVSHFVAIERDVTSSKELEQQHIKSAQTDPLTGVLNRRGFTESVQSHPSLLHKGYSVVAIDLDHFKRVNDQYGHSTGDVVLQKTAKILLDISRDHDLVARFGGEEFILLLPETSLQIANSVAERIRVSVEQYPIVIESVNLSVSISLGVAEDEFGTQLEQTLKNADDALYQAKRNGRNQVVNFSED